jgi:uncharacterized membrane protein
MILLPTGFQKQLYKNSQTVRAKVIQTDDTALYGTGIVTQGEQRCELIIQSGSHEGKTVTGINLMQGSIETDKVFVPGDLAFVILEQDDHGEPTFATMVDYYRIRSEILLAGCFALLLVLFSGLKGVRTLLGFAATILAIWKVLVPALLKGYPPLLVALLIGNSITIVILLLVGGFNKKSYTAIAASMASSLATCLFAILFTRIFNLHGSVMQSSEGLLHAGFQNLDLTAIFQAGIYLACTGAVMDMSIDIASALEEIKRSAPDISQRQLFLSGIRIGHSVVGTQTTTLLMAYIGSYLSMMMVYMAQGTSIQTILTSRMIAAEILATLVGCIGVVLVSPLTSLIGSIWFSRHESEVVA